MAAGLVEVLTESVLTKGSHYLNAGDGHVNPLMFENVPDKMKDKEVRGVCLFCEDAEKAGRRADTPAHFLVGAAEKRQVGHDRHLQLLRG